MRLGAAQIALWSAAQSLSALLLVLAFARTRAQARAAVHIAALSGGYAAIELALFALRAHLLPGHHFPWPGKALVAALVPLMAAARVAPSNRAMGLSTWPARDALLPIVLAVAVCVAAAFFDPSIPRVPSWAETIAWQATLPGLDEELVWRGWALAVLDRAFARRWRIAGAHFGPGAIVVAALFVWGHLFSIDAALWPHVDATVVGTTSLIVLSVLFTWIRARAQSVWPAVIAHNVSNAAITLAHWIGWLA